MSILLVFLLGLAGCESGPSASTSGGGTSMLGGAIDEYNSRHFAEARAEATKVMHDANGHQREQAAYLAGLSAYQQGQFDEAERHLLIAAASSNLRTAGSARAMLGLIRTRQQRTREAAEHFRAAAGVLDGDDARKAAHQAALAYQQVGDESAARTWFAMASRPGAPLAHAPATTRADGRPSAADTPLPTGGAPRANTTIDRGFTLQVGAYQQRDLAERAADEAHRVAWASGLGSVRIVTGQDDRGRSLHLVQLGRFETRQAAASARQRVGKLQYIVAPYSQTAAR